MQLRQALEEALKILVGHRIPSPGLTAEVLLMHTLGCSRTHLHSHPEQDLGGKTIDEYFCDIRERASGTPTQYIVGHQEFWGLDFVVNRDVLIPRPESEHLVEGVLEHIDTAGISRDQPLCLVDVGTGSGCIALALAHELLHAVIFACDLSAKALHVATMNAERLGMRHRVKFIEGDLLAPFLKPEFVGSMDFVVSNPPYVGREELRTLQREVRDREPRVALGGLKTCEEIYRRLIPEAQQVLRPGACVLLEIGSNMEQMVSNLFGEGWTRPRASKDLRGLPRVISACKQGDETVLPSQDCHQG